MTISRASILDGNDISAIERAVKLLRQDQIVAIPTETVYGLAARATSPKAIAKIFAVKNRPTQHPLILHIADLSDLDRWTNDHSLTAKVLASKYWPGPLTIILKRSNLVCDEITGGRETVAVRFPRHPIATKLIQQLGEAIVAPSANRFGRVSPTSAEHVANDIGDDIQLILDGGQCNIGLESTIVDCTVDPPQLLRAGALTTEQILTECNITIAAASGESRASGMLDKHYAPNCKVELFMNRFLADVRLHELTRKKLNAVILDFGDNLELFARELYNRFRDADLRGLDVIVVVKPPMHGLGVAINERLEKASNSG